MAKRGGYRPGAGRPPAEKVVVLEALGKRRGRKQSPLEYMLRVMNDPNVDVTRRDRMAIAAAPFVHQRMADVRIGSRARALAAAQEDNAGTRLGRLMIEHDQDGLTVN